MIGKQINWIKSLIASYKKHEDNGVNRAYFEGKRHALELVLDMIDSGNDQMARYYNEH